MNGLVFFVLLPILYLIPLEMFTFMLHKHVMHGFGWAWHESHHHNPGAGLEKNDYYAVYFAIFSILLFYINHAIFQSFWLLSIAIGITLYGACYFFVHDVLIHRRIKNRLHKKITNPYIQRLIRAHLIHHKLKCKEGNEAFGFLYAPVKYKKTTTNVV